MDGQLRQVHTQAFEENNLSEDQVESVVKLAELAGCMIVCSIGEIKENTTKGRDFTPGSLVD